MLSAIIKKLIALDHRWVSFQDHQSFSIIVSTWNSVAYMLPAQGPRCTKCSRPTKGHALQYGVNCMLAPIEDSMNDSRDILSGTEDTLEVPCLCRHSIPGKPEDLMAESAALGMVVYTSEQGPCALPPTAPATMASPATTTPTITAASILSGVLTEDALAVLSTMLGQQGTERAKDRCHFKELLQQLTETNDQLAYIKKALDCLVLAKPQHPQLQQSSLSLALPLGQHLLQAAVAFNWSRPHHFWA